ncbi:GNAT family N-acetyltransferase [Streptomyces sp. NBC_01571]|uniref:GNAT family N-acetyltransferase n=1 Tax=Streptomyces sp. NBC_01571 TaxID=2975883 RepID=UPI00225BD021|nr:GNAT family N-acetyltransferase [Streptomyces sp. NBC_01571]MCX4578969.1 GNAT family N-acetyltransferase [Streptomyces sp. NBC_01571]
MTKKGGSSEVADQSGAFPREGPARAREPTPAVLQLAVSSLLVDPTPRPITTRANQLTLTRTAHLNDLDEVNSMHARCSLESRYARYHAARQAVTTREWGHLCDRSDGTTLVTIPLQEPTRIIAVTHLLRTSVPHVRELGILVEDSWQGQGLGTALAHYAVDLARTHTLDCYGIAAMAGSGNQRMLSILRGLHARVTGRDGPTLNTVIPVEA